jgi:hypothetical protein
MEIYLGKNNKMSIEKRNDSIWTESYIKSVWQSYDVGDTIK